MEEFNMPIFEYKCEDCGLEFEKLVHSADEKIVCDKCASEKVTKKFSSFAAKISTGSSASNSCSVSDCSSCCPGGTCGI
jgi:putative FmdB family regulatory protein